MKSTYQHLVFVVTLLALSASAYAQSPREQLNQMLEQLQKAPNDDLLRERIIKLGAELKPSPAISDVALNHEGRGISAFKTATDVEDYIAAAREFEAASLAAPWVAGYYSDMCTAYEKGGAFQEAASSCRLYSLAVTDEREIREAKIRAAGIQYKAQNVSEFELRKLNNSKKPFRDVPYMPTGKLFFCNDNNYQSSENVFRFGNAQLAAHGRYEVWIVKNGARASVVVVFWVSTESFSELMRAGVVIKNPLIKEFPGRAERSVNELEYSTGAVRAPFIGIANDESLAVIYGRTVGRGPVVTAVCDPIQ